MRLAVIYSAILIGLLSLAFVLEDYSKGECYRNSRPGITATNFVDAAKDMMKEKFPEWFVEETPVYISSSQEEQLLGRAGPNPDGELVIYLFPESLRFCSVEDLTSVLLHEFVHVKKWYELDELFPGDDKSCRNARHELLANLEVIRARKELPYNLELYELFTGLYDEYYLFASAVCEPEIYKDLPGPLLRSLYPIMVPALLGAHYPVYLELPYGQGKRGFRIYWN